MLANGLGNRQPRERLAELDLLALVGDRCVAGGGADLVVAVDLSWGKLGPYRRSKERAVARMGPLLEQILR